MPSRQNSTFLKVTFYTWDFGTIVAYRSQSIPNLGRSVLVGDVTQFSVTKNLGAPTASWSMTLKGGYAPNGKKWPDILHDGDWVKVNVVKNGTERHVMLGRVDTVNLSVTAGSDGTAEIVVSLGGRDVGAIPEDAPIYFNPYDPSQSNIVGERMAPIVGSAMTGPPDELVKRLLIGVGEKPAYGFPAQVPPGVFDTAAATWTDHVRTDFVERVRGIIHAPQVLVPSDNTPVWSFVAQFSNPALNELYLDTDPQTGIGDDYPAMHLYFREKPFENVTDGDSSPWFLDTVKIQVHELDCRFLTAVNLSRGRNRINHVFLTGEVSALFGVEVVGITSPTLNEESIQRWGLRRLDQRTAYLGEQDNGGAVHWTTDHAAIQRLIRDWNALNHDHWTGVVVLPEMRVDIRIGQKVYLTQGPAGGYRVWPADGGSREKALSAYVEAVQHTWADGPSPMAQTQLMLSRGYVEGDRLADLQTAAVGWSQVVSGGDSGSVNEATIRPYVRPVNP